MQVRVLGHFYSFRAGNDHLVCEVLPTLGSILIFLDKCHKLLSTFVNLSTVALSWVFFNEVTSNIL